MDKIFLPEIVALGIFNAQLAVKSGGVTKNRRTTMFEIELPTEDGGTSYIDDECREIKRDTLIVAKPGQIRHTRLPFKCYFVHLILEEGELFDRLSRIPTFVRVKDRERYEQIFEKLCECYNTNLYRDILHLQSLLLELIHILGDYTDASSHTGKRRDRETIERVVDYVKSNLTSDLSLEEVSRFASFSPTHFHNLFKKATGKTLRDFVEEQRIQKSIQLLISTDLTLSEIAYECGFSSQSYFSYAFRKRMNIPPREYARRIYERYGEGELL